MHFYKRRKSQFKFLLCFLCLCFSKSLTSTKPISQNSQVCGVLFECLRISCFLTELLWLKQSVQNLHFNGLYCLCEFMWLLRLSFVVNDALHMSHTKSLIPVCRFICVFSCPFWTNVSSHSSHLNLFILLCILAWSLKWEDLWKNVLHSKQTKCFSLMWVLKCLVNPLLFEKRFFALEHLKICSVWALCKS